MSPATSRTLRVVVSLALAAGLLALFLRNVDFAAVGRAIANAHLGWLAFGTAVSILVVLLRAWRWIRLLRPVGRPPFLRLVPERLRARAASIVRSFIEGLGALRTPGDVAVVAISSFALWLLVTVQIYATLRAFDLDLPFPVSFFLLTWFVIGLAIPTPGGVGG